MLTFSIIHDIIITETRKTQTRKRGKENEKLEKCTDLLQSC